MKESDISNQYEHEAIIYLDSLPKRESTVVFYQMFRKFLVSQEYYSEAIECINWEFDNVAEKTGNLTKLVKAELLFRDNKFMEAEQEYRKILKSEFSKDCPEKRFYIYSHLVFCLIYQNKNIKEAKKMTRKALLLVEKCSECHTDEFNIKVNVLRFFKDIKRRDIPKLIEDVKREYGTHERRFFQQSEEYINVKRFLKNVNNELSCIVCFKQSIKLKHCSACR